MASAPRQDVGSIRRELATVKAELYNLQTARSVRSAQFIKQLVKSRRVNELISHVKTAPDLLRRAEPPKISNIDAYDFQNAAQSPAPLFMYANLNVALIGDAGKSIFLPTTNCVPFGGSEFKILAKFDSVQLIVVDFDVYSDTLHNDIAKYVNNSSVAKLVILADLTKHTSGYIQSHFGSLPHSIVDINDTSMLHIDIYRIGSHQIAVKDLRVINTTDSLPDNPDVKSDEILMIDYSKLKGRPALSANHRILLLAASGVPIVFKGSVPDIFKGSPFLSVASNEDCSHLQMEPYSADRYRATTKRYVIASFNALRPTNKILSDCLPDIALKDPLRPSISVLLPTRRPEFVSDALDQLESQTVRPHEVILMLHGVSEEDYESTKKRAAKSPLTVEVLRYSKDKLFGQVLNEGLQYATGEFTTKVDDDDHYGSNHLLDLCVARLHSQADIVGKWNNWIHITSSDEVISWVPEKENGYYGHLPGGTIMAKTELFKNLGFGYVRHGIDSELYERARRRGVIMYSTHRYNYVRVRHDDHTYTAKNSDFMSRAHAVRFKGLNLDNLFC